MKDYHEMMALLNACEITRKKAVSCLIGGLNDRVIKTGAKAGRQYNDERFPNQLTNNQNRSNRLMETRATNSSGLENQNNVMCFKYTLPTSEIPL